jgi:3-oxoacyl-[acyl-carrier protein] reductase
VELGLEGRIALVTGASKGIGLGIATFLRGEGVEVAMSSRSQERISAAADSVDGHPFVHDSGDIESAGALVDQVESELGPVDILVTNTGGPPPGEDPAGFTREQWETAYRDLVLSPMALIERVLPGMRERGFGRIVNVSSMAVREPIPVLMLSNVHRSGMLAGFKTLARAVAGDGVTLNTLLPGRIDTDRVAQSHGSREAAVEAARREVPAGRLGKPEEMGAAAAFLCSDQAGYITGVALLVDGGVTRSV